MQTFPFLPLKDACPCQCKFKNQNVDFRIVEEEKGFEIEYMLGCDQVKALTEMMIQVQNLEVFLSKIIWSTKVF